MNDPLPLVIYVDVDDTLVRSVGTKRIPMPSAIAWVRQLKEQGAQLYCWSSGGGVYAKASAEEFGIVDCFEAFLPKPQVLLDDQRVEEWRSLLQVRPGESRSVEELRLLLRENQAMNDEQIKMLSCQYAKAPASGMG